MKNYHADSSALMQERRDGIALDAGIIPFTHAEFATEESITLYGSVPGEVHMRIKQHGTCAE